MTKKINVQMNITSFSDVAGDDVAIESTMPPRRRQRKPCQNAAKLNFSISEQSRIIEMAWEDRTPFEAIEALYGLTPAQLVHQMRAWLKPSSFRLWRQRMNGRATKHASLRPAGVNRAYCPTQYKR
jgi:uncharacterized protein (TIGR03643 family)